MLSRIFLGFQVKVEKLFQMTADNVVNQYVEETKQQQQKLGGGALCSSDATKSVLNDMVELIEALTRMDMKLAATTAVQAANKLPPGELFQPLS